MMRFIRAYVALGRLSAMVVCITVGLAAVATHVRAQDEGLKSTVAAAANRLASQSYRWETRVSSVDPESSAEPVSRAAGAGRQGPNGYVHVEGVLANADVEFVVKDGKAAILSDGNWMTWNKPNSEALGADAVGGVGHVLATVAGHLARLSTNSSHRLARPLRCWSRPRAFNPQQTRSQHVSRQKWRPSCTNPAMRGLDFAGALVLAAGQVVREDVARVAGDRVPLVDGGQETSSSQSLK